MFTRTQTRLVHVGAVPLGGGAPVSVQTMTTADPHDAAALTAQILRCAEAGAQIVRLTVPDEAAARVLGEVRRQVPVPLVADIHFDYRCALAAISAGADALRLNPGNIGGKEQVRAVARAAREKGIPIRVGVNAGSLEKGETLVSSALKHVKLLEDEAFRDIVISVKASDVPRTLAAYRELAEKTDCPLHLGVTEAGTFLPGTVRSSVALGILLSEGIGDTVRVSLTDDPVREVRVGLEILRALSLAEPGAAVTSCPTCGRTRVDVVRTAEAVEMALERHFRRHGYPVGGLPHVAVMGCAVNGPGEAKGADVALCGGKDEFLLYVKGRPDRKVKPEEAVEAVIESLPRVCAPDPLVEEMFARAQAADGVVFDFGGVMSVSPLENWSLYPYCAARGIDRAALARAWTNYRHLWDGGTMTFDEMYRRIFADSGLPPPDDVTLAELWHADAEAWVETWRTDTLELMRRLKAAGKKIGILSNMAEDFHRRLFVPRAAKYRMLADVEVISGLEKCYKPEREIYTLTQRRMGLPPERLLFFDDTPANVEAARRYGWQSEVYPPQKAR